VLPGYVRMDGGLYFVRGRYDVTLRVNNLFDEVYYESSFGVVQIRPGRPRDAALSLRIHL
jgi:outer membrane receptor protein involved in Fe transport